ncbi:MAG: Crp/Fnr family transcriptional regulator [Clostridium sp.]|nr:Crp/Fnr family transcriptional regulator [Clostridium sp.]
MESMYQTILNLPLFKGVTYNRISEIVGQTKFHFLKYPGGDTIVSAGERCSHVKFIISGSARMTIISSDNRFRVGQTLTSPSVIAPDFLFGRTTMYPGTLVAETPTGIMQIDKSDYVEILHSDRVFLYNFLNMLSLNAQKSVDGILAVTTGSLEQRIAFWVMSLTQPDATEITLGCRHRDLYSLFGVQRSTFIATLDSLASRGIVSYGMNELRILSRPALIELLSHPSEQ